MVGYISRTRKAALYCRVSSEEQAKFGFSIKNQLDRLQTYCEEENITIVEVYMDEGFSAGTKKRPALQKMLEDKRNFDLVLFTKLDRFTRNVLDANEMLKELQAFNVNIKAIDEDDIDTSTADGMFMFNLKVSLAQRELAKGSERIKTVFDYKVKKGQPITGAVTYGYRIHTADDGSKSIVIDEEVEHIVMEFFVHFLTYNSIRGAGKYINEKYNLDRSYDAYRRMLRREIYTGTYRGNTEYCPPYIDRQTFDKIQDLIKRNIKVRKKPSFHLFIGLLTCPHCGRKLHAKLITKHLKKTNKTVEYVYYLCKGNMIKNSGRCPVSLREDVLEKKLLANIKPLAEKYIYEAKLKPVEEPKKKNELAELLDELDRLNYSFRKKRISVKEYDEEYDALERKIAAAKTEAPKEKDITGMEAFLNSGWEEVYNNLTRENKRALIRSVVKSIELDDNEEIQIEFI